MNSKPAKQNFSKVQEREKFVKTVKDFGVSKPTIALKISLVKMIDKYPKLENSSLSLNFIKVKI